MENFVDFGQTLGVGVPGRENDRDGKSREIHLSDGTSVKVESRDPYGHWYAKWNKGAVPKELDGCWTSAEQAVLAVKAFIGNQKYNTKVVDTPVQKAPPLEYKKPKAA